LPATAANDDISSDGQHFLMLKPAAGSETPYIQMNIVLNWFEELKRRVPTGKKRGSAGGRGEKGWLRLAAQRIEYYTRAARARVSERGGRS
jgi:hypothetical protein